MNHLETQRLSLQPVEPTELDSLAVIWADSQVMRYLPTGAPRSKEASG
ncbi:MAG TPA: hypothetical protein VGJ97_03300 [Anaerolineaceae bacterium]|jgi:RimJ/RimL family protein N-acetyltransferase